jgi:hypothetical protein
VNERKRHSGSAFRAIRAIDYTVIVVRDMAAMRHFYEDILGFPLLRELSPDWIEYRVGDNTLALARPSRSDQLSVHLSVQSGDSERECIGAPHRSHGLIAVYVAAWCCTLTYLSRRAATSRGSSCVLRFTSVTSTSQTANPSRDAAGV